MYISHTFRDTAHIIIVTQVESFAINPITVY